MSEKLLSEELPFAVMKRTWQPVALSDELPVGGLKSFYLLDREILIARFNSGLVVADNACPHKGFRLSKSSICQNELVCAYHGWRFGKDGACTKIPSLPEATPQKLNAAALRTYGVKERYGHIWVQIETDENIRIPEIPEFENNWTFLIGPPTPFAAGWRREVENFLDMTHFAFAHASTLGQAADPRVPEMQIEVANLEENMNPSQPHISMRTQFPALQTQQEQPGKLSQAHARFYRTWLPNFTAIRQTWPDGDERILLHIPVPNSRESCTVFWALAISPNFAGPPPQAQLDFAVRVLDEDREMCENQLPREVPLNPSRGGWGVLVAPGDTLANTFQRTLRQWLAQRKP